MANRYYDPEIGRFITADPLGYVDGPSMYQFGGYSPMNLGDPMGLQNEINKEAVRRASQRMSPGRIIELEEQRAQLAKAQKQVHEETSSWTVFWTWTGLRTPSIADVMDPTLDTLTGLDRTASEIATVGEKIDQGLQSRRYSSVERYVTENPGTWHTSGPGLRQASEAGQQSRRAGASARETFVSGLTAYERWMLATGLAHMVYEGGRYVVRRLPGTSAGLRRFVDGDLFEAAVQSDAGTVRVLAETSVSGRTLTLSDLVVYAEDGTLVNQVGPRQFLTLRTQVAREAAEAGFDTLRITGVRVQTSSSANPGAAIDRVIDLSRFK